MKAVTRFHRSLAPLVAMFALAARRLWQNRRMAASLLVGFTVAVAATAAIPVYSVSALQRVLTGDLRAQAGPVPISIQLNHVENEKRPTTLPQFESADRIARVDGPRLIDLPISTLVRDGNLDVASTVPVDPTRVNPDKARWIALGFRADLEKHVKVIDGRLPKPGLNDRGDYEVMIRDTALDKQDFAVGAEFWVPLSRADGAPRVRAQVVGAFVPGDQSEPYWSLGVNFDQTFFMAEETFRQSILTAKDVAPHEYGWDYIVSSDAIRVTDAARLVSGLDELGSRTLQALPDTVYWYGPTELLNRYVARAGALNLMLLWLAIPALAVVAYFLVVTASLMVEGQRQEIAVLRSRGASLWQVALVYTLEGVLLAGGSLALGYPLGALLARAIGSTAGFLQFVNRRQVPLQLPSQFYLYGLLAALLAVAAYVTPAMLAARQSIITYKQESARQLRRPIWSRFGLDLVSLGLAGYGYYTLGQAQKTLAALTAIRAQNGVTADVQLVEPLHIIAPALLVFGGGLFLMRILPLLIRLVEKLCDRWATAPLYLTLMQLSRVPGQYTTVILLLTLTVGMGLYSAAAARTMEQNTADRVEYRVGADVVLQEVWDYDQSEGTATEGSLQAAGAPPMSGGVFIPPPWHAHDSLPGVVHAARVRIDKVVPSVGGGAKTDGLLMSVDTPDFGQVAWFRRDLEPYHINSYLNLLAENEEGVLVANSFMKANKLKPGDRIQLNEDGRNIDLMILAGVDYWPSFYPQQAPFFVANLAYVEQEMGIVPYQVWLKLQPGAPLTPVVAALRDKGILMMYTVDARQALITARRDPQLGGLLGGLTSGFLLAALITVLGFWIYAALSVRSRVLQCGVLRAIGLSVPQLLTAVAMEQILSAVIGVAVGTGLGLAAARLYVPFLQQGVDAASQTPPFVVVASAADSLRLYVVLLVMLVAGLAGLLAALARMRVHEAVKLGEDH